MVAHLLLGSDGLVDGEGLQLPADCHLRPDLGDGVGAGAGAELLHLLDQQLSSISRNVETEQLLIALVRHLVDAGQRGLEHLLAGLRQLVRLARHVASAERIILLSAVVSTWQILQSLLHYILSHFKFSLAHNQN